MKILGQKMFAKVMSKKELFTNEKGAQSLEWLGIAALLIMVVGIVSTYLGGTGQSTIEGILGDIMTSIQEQIGD